LDIICADFSHDGIIWFENMDGSGGSWTQRTIASGTKQITRIDITDMDNDGDGDILAVCPSDQKLLVFENKGGGVFQQRQIWNQYANPRAAVWADINRDALPDILASFNASTQAAWFENTYAQYFANFFPVAPAYVMETQRAALMRMDVRHLGRAGDSPVTPYTLALIPYEKEGGKIMLGSDVMNLVDTISFFRDANGNKKWDDMDTMIFEMDITAYINDPSERNWLVGKIPELLQPLCAVEAEKEATFFIAARFKQGAASNPIHSCFLDTYYFEDNVIDFKSKNLIKPPLKGANRKTGVLITVIPYSVQTKGWMLY